MEFLSCILACRFWSLLLLFLRPPTLQTNTLFLFYQHDAAILKNFSVVFDGTVVTVDKVQQQAENIPAYVTPIVMEGQTFERDVPSKMLGSMLYKASAARVCVLGDIPNSCQHLTPLLSSIAGFNRILFYHS